MKGDFLSTISCGNEFSVKLNINEELVKQFGILSGDFNPLHTDDAFARSKGFVGRVCYGNILGMLISKIVGMGLGTSEVMLISEKIDFKHPVYVGDTIELKGEVVQISEAVSVIELNLSFWNDLNVKVAYGKCAVRGL